MHSLDIEFVVDEELTLKIFLLLMLKNYLQSLIGTDRI